MKRTVSHARFAFALASLIGQAVAILLLVLGTDKHSALWCSVTFGDSSAPSDVTTYLDSLFSQSLAYYQPKMVDNIGQLNAFFFKLIKSGMYKSYTGGTDIRENLIYALTSGDWYDGYEELPDQPTDGVTQSIFEARQMAVPISYSMKEAIQNREKLDDLVETKMTQAEMGTQETYSQSLMWGAGDGALATPRTGSSGASAIDPLSKMIAYDPTASLSIGNINQSTNLWWRNQTKNSTSTTTYDGLIKDSLNIFDTCSLGTGGQPDLFLVDQVTYEAMSFAFYVRYRQTSSDNDFPFTNIKMPFGNGSTLMVMDDKVPDIVNNTKSTATKGTAFLINTKFFKIRYIPERDFEMLKDENGKTFKKPPKGDSRVGHIAWMGATTISNRRKHGVMGNIARSFT